MAVLNTNAVSGSERSAFDMGAGQLWEDMPSMVQPDVTQEPGPIVFNSHFPTICGHTSSESI